MRLLSDCYHKLAGGRRMRKVLMFLVFVQCYESVDMVT